MNFFFRTALFHFWKIIATIIANDHFYFITDITDLNVSQDNKNDTFDESAIIMAEDDDKKVFYLFTRTPREKEEWFNHLSVAAKFMEDW